MKSISNLVFKSYLDDGERIISTAHTHIITFKIAAAKVSFFGIIVPIVLYFLFPIHQVFVISTMWVIVGICGWIYYFLDWYYDVWLITNHGVISVVRTGLFDMSTQRVDYHYINDISYTCKGFLQTILHYGDISIDKVSSGNPVVLKDAANPKKIERLISKNRDSFVRQKSFTDHNQLKDMLADMIAYHVSTGKIDKSKNN